MQVRLLFEVSIVWYCYVVLLLVLADEDCAEERMELKAEICKRQPTQLLGQGTQVASTGWKVCPTPQF